MVATGAMQQGMMGRHDIPLLAAPDLKGGLLDGTREGEHERPWRMPIRFVAAIHGV
jgi:hypothetical protein